MVIGTAAGVTDTSVLGVTGGLAPSAVGVAGTTAVGVSAIVARVLAREPAAGAVGVVGTAAVGMSGIPAMGLTRAFAKGADRWPFCSTCCAEGPATGRRGTGAVWWASCFTAVPAPCGEAVPGRRGTGMGAVPRPFRRGAAADPAEYPEPGRRGTGAVRWPFCRGPALAGAAWRSSTSTPRRPFCPISSPPCLFCSGVDSIFEDRCTFSPKSII